MHELLLPKLFLFVFLTSAFKKVAVYGIEIDTVSMNDFYTHP